MRLIKRHLKVIVVASIFIIIAVSLILVRLTLFQQYDISKSGSNWRLYYNIEINISKSKTRIFFAIPRDLNHIKILDEKIEQKESSFDIIKNKETQDREIVLTSHKKSISLSLTAEFDINIKYGKISNKPKSSVLPIKLHKKYLKSEKYIQKNHYLIKTINKIITKNTDSTNDIIDSIYNYCIQYLKHSKNGSRDALNTLKIGSGNNIGLSRAMIALCRFNKIPARLVCGFILENNTITKPKYWIEVYNKKWMQYDLKNKYEKKLPPNYLPVRHGGDKIYRNLSGANIFYTYTIECLDVNQNLEKSDDSIISNLFDLKRLPISMQETIIIILLLPIGAIITVLFRNFIGIKTFGIFAPVLIALSQINSNLIVGILLIMIALFIGILNRILLKWLKLLAVPRLSIILTFVVIYLILAISLCEYLGLAPSAQSILLPVVIMTIMIERFFIILEEDGFKITIKVLFNTLIVALSCYLVLSIDFLGNLLLSYPEIELIIISILLIIGRYSGYRLNELFRFRDLVK